MVGISSSTTSSFVTLGATYFKVLTGVGTSTRGGGGVLGMIGGGWSSVTTLLKSFLLSWPVSLERNNSARVGPAITSTASNDLINTINFGMFLFFSSSSLRIPVCEKLVTLTSGSVIPIYQKILSFFPMTKVKTCFSFTLGGSFSSSSGIVISIVWGLFRVVVI